MLESLIQIALGLLGTVLIAVLAYRYRMKKRFPVVERGLDYYRVKSFNPDDYETETVWLPVRLIDGGLVHAYLDGENNNLALCGALIDDAYEIIGDNIYGPALSCPICRPRYRAMLNGDNSHDTSYIFN